MQRAARLLLRNVVIVTIAAGCSIASPTEQGEVGASSSAISGGAADITAPEANAIIHVGCTKANCIRGSAVALTPLLYLTSNHMVTGSTQGNAPATDFVAEFSPVSYVAWDKKRPPSTRKATAINPNLANDLAQDVALVYLDQAAIDLPNIWPS